MSASHQGTDPSFPGRILLIVGIAIQLGFSSTFVILTISFHVKFALYRVWVPYRTSSTSIITTEDACIISRPTLFYYLQAEA